MLKHYVTFDEPGAFMPESSTREVETRVPADLKKIPQYCYAIAYFDREEIFSEIMLCEKDIEFIPSKIGMRDVCEKCEHKFKCATDKPKGEVLRGKPKNKSPRILFGKKYSLKEIKALEGEDLPLYRNIEQFDSKTGVKCIAGNWQPLQEGEIVVSSHAELKNMMEAW